MGKTDNDQQRQPLIEDPQLYKEEPLPKKSRFDFSRENVMLGIYLISVILVGTGNRVTFKLMQYSIINYTYFVSQLTTFIYIPVNGVVLLVKLFFTKDITPEMKAFPVHKYAVMGLLDSLQGLLIVVGGAFVPGIMQNLLLQGVVVVTMGFSLLLLKPKGCESCQRIKKYFDDRKIKYEERPSVSNCSVKCCASVTMDNVQLDIQHDDDTIAFEAVSDYLDRRSSTPNIIIYTSAKPWGEHLKTYYTAWQYLGAAIIMGGLVLSVWPALTASGCGLGNPAGPPLFDLIFFSATIPTAISAVYKEIAFRKVDLDVWLVNFWVSLFQFFFGLLYAPLAAVMSGLPIVDIPQNLYRGLLCWLLGTNFIGQTVDPCLDNVCEPLSYPVCSYTCPVADDWSPYDDPTTCPDPVIDFYSMGTDDSFSTGDDLGIIDCNADYFIVCDPLVNVTDCLAVNCPYLNSSDTIIYGPNYGSPSGDDDDSPSCYPYCSSVCTSPGTACINCGPGGTGTCCDSCDGSIACLSDRSAMVSVALYMAFNIAYNTLLLLVIKYGSAALMYVASTVVLPLGSVAFTRKFLMGDHASEFTIYNGGGLAIVLLGLIIYRFIGKKSQPHEQVGADIVQGDANFSVFGRYYEDDVEVLEAKPRTAQQVRSAYYNTLGISPNGQ